MPGGDHRCSAGEKKGFEMAGAGFQYL